MGPVRVSLRSEPHDDALAAVWLDKCLECGGRALAPANDDLVQGHPPSLNS